MVRILYCNVYETTKNDIILVQPDNDVSIINEEIPPIQNETIPMSTHEDIHPIQNETIPISTHEDIPPIQNETMPISTHEDIPPIPHEPISMSTHEDIPPIQNAPTPISTNNGESQDPISNIEIENYSDKNQINDFINKFKNIYINMHFYIYHNNSILDQSNKTDINSTQAYWYIYTKCPILLQEFSKINIIVEFNRLRHFIIPSYFIYWKYKTNFALMLGDTNVFTYYFMIKNINIHMRYFLYKIMNSKSNEIINFDLSQLIPKVGMNFSCTIDNIENLLHDIYMQLFLSYNSYKSIDPSIFGLLRSSEIDILAGLIFKQLLFLNINFYHNKKTFINSVLDFNLQLPISDHKTLIEMQVNTGYLLYIMSTEKIHKIFRYIYIHCEYKDHNQPSDTFIASLLLQFILYTYTKKIDDVILKFNVLFKLYINHNMNIVIECLIYPQFHMKISNNNINTNKELPQIQNI